MSKNRKETTYEERKIIINLRKQNKSLQEISKIVKRPRATVQHILERYFLQKSIQNRKRTGRPRKVDEYTRRFIIRQVKYNPRISAPKISIGLEKDCGKKISASTVRYVLRQNGYHGRIARRKFFVSEINRKKRLRYAIQYKGKTIEFWNKVIFSDETKYNLYSSDGRIRIWRTKNTEYNIKNLSPTFKGNQSVSLWGCMSANGVGNIEFINGIMDQYKYINILKANLRSSAEKMNLGQDFIFMQDNDPKHTALNTRLWILYNVKNYMKTPPQSPDVNPIEQIWDVLDKNIRKHDIKNIPDLKQAITTEWSNIPSVLTMRLVNSMPKRLNHIIKHKGNPTKY